MSKQKLSVGQVLIIIIAFILIIFFIIDKNEEQKRLQKVINWFKKRRTEIGEKLIVQEKKFRRAYNGFKILVGGVFFSIVVLIVNLTPDYNIFDSISNCLNVFAGLGMLFVLLCFFVEEDPLTIFHLRNSIRTKLYSIYIEPLQSELESARIMEIEQHEAEEEMKLNDDSIKDLEALLKAQQENTGAD